MMVHGSTVALAGKAVLITGPAGSGKSALALALMAMGAGLVSDDWTELSARDGRVMADAPATIRGRIEARHVGVLAAEAMGPQPLALVVELGGAAAPRLPQEDSVELLGHRLPRLAATFDARLAPALRQWLIGGRVA